MPSVAVIEPTSTRVIKSPLRMLGGTVSGTGAVLKGIGHGTHSRRRQNEDGQEQAVGSRGGCEV